MNTYIDKDSKIQNILTSLEEFMGEIDKDQFSMMEGTLSKSKFEFWEKLHQAKTDKLWGINFMLYNKTELDTRVLFLLLHSYLYDLTKLDSINDVLKLAIRVNDNLDVDVWSEIKDDNELAERDIILTTANFNTKIYGLGYYFNLMVVEESDEIEIPRSFDLLNLSELFSKK
ncbi:MAG: hypothetical protein AB8E82_00425 [Aureispira sp.]